jgi:hypothetical protein
LTCNVKGDLRYRGRTTAAAIANAFDDALFAAALDGIEDLARLDPALAVDKGNFQYPARTTTATIANAKGNLQHRARTTTATIANAKGNRQYRGRTTTATIANAKGNRQYRARPTTATIANAKGNLRYRARISTATIALVAGGYLVMSGTTAVPAAGEINKEGGLLGWLTQMWPATRVDPAEDQVNAQQVNAQYAALYSEEEKTASKKKTASNTADPTASTRLSVAGNADLFQPGPQYDKNWDAKAQIDTYGAKVAVEPPRPLELGRQQYTSGEYAPSGTLLGELNPLMPGLSIYGDWRTAVAYNGNAGKDIAQVATRLNIDVDYKITGTERIHAFFTPIQNANKFTRYEFGGGDGDKKFTGEYDLAPQTLFFEGDLGSITSGLSGNPASFDLPFTVGLFPLFLQNGIWANDAILGGAVSLTAKNSKRLGLANYDVTFFAAFDNVDNKGILGADNRHNANIYGVTTFIDAFGGYIEAGYGLIQSVDSNVLLPGFDNRVVGGQLTHFLAAAYTRRYANILSNTTRVFANFGNGKDDDGVVLISENSLISGLPSTLLPYANFFVGYGNPQPLVDGNGAGILKNVGINFETDALTGYPKLNDSGSNAYGGAIGVQYLFNLDQQLVFEVAAVQPYGDVIAGIGVAQPQYGFGVRYQIPIDRAWLFRADATYQILEGGDKENFGVRSEIRRKF